MFIATNDKENIRQNNMPAQIENEINNQNCWWCDSRAQTHFTM